MRVGVFGAALAFASVGLAGGAAAQSGQAGLPPCLQPPFDSDPAKRVEICTRLIEDRSTPPNFALAARAARSTAYLAQRAYPEAIKDLDIVIEKTRTNATALNARCWARGLGMIALNRAMADCNLALKLKPDSAGTFDTRALIHFRRGDFAAAVADGDKALALEPRAAPALYLRGLAKQRLGQAEAGKADIDQARSIDPAVGDLYRLHEVAS